MTSNPDPKPGRWILPLVIVGMIGFTYLFVNSLNSGATGSDGGSTTSTSDGGSATPTTDGGAGNAGGTTVPTPSANPAYIEALRTAQGELAIIATTMNDTNTAWEEDAEAAGFTNTRNTFQDLAESSQEWAAGVTDISPPRGGGRQHRQITQHAEAVATAADGVLQGLLAPDDGSLRRQAVEDFNEAVAAYDRAVDAIEGGAGA